MIKLAARMLRQRPGSTVATLLALAVGAMILSAMGVLVESGLMHRAEPHRYAAADAIVANRDLTVTGKDLDGSAITSTVPLEEGGTLDAGLVEELGRIPGVTGVIADVTLPVVPVAAPGVPVAGHGWGSAALMPYELTAGTDPARSDQVVLDTRLAAAAGVGPGQPVELLVDGVARQYVVSGVAAGTLEAGTRPTAVFFTDKTAASLSPRPGRIDAAGLFLSADADRAAVRELAGKAGARVYEGDELGRAETSAEDGMASLLIQIGASFGGYVVLLVVFVVAGTVGLSIRHRRRDLALLRAVAATPGQVRRMMLAEATLTGIVASLIGIPAGLLAARWVHGELVDRGFLSDTFPMVPGVLSAAAVAVLTVVVAVLAALLAVRRLSGIRPAEALGESAIEPGRGGKVRFAFGMATLIGAVASSTVTVAASGEVALTGALGMLYLFVTAVALLAPWINLAAARMLGPVFRRLWGTSGHLATANLRANAKGGATVLTALVLSVGFGGSVWFLQDNIERATLTQNRDGLIAEHIVASPAGLPEGTAAELAALPGVEAVTPIRRTSVVVPIIGGEAESVAAQAIDPRGADRTLDLGVTDGKLSDLDKGGIAVSSIRAGQKGWQAGDSIDLWLGDGTPITLRVAAVYERGLGFGDVILHRDTVAGHTARTTDDEILVAGALPDPELPFALVGDAAGRTGEVAADLALSAWLNKLLVGVMVGYSALAAANTMVMAALARRRELAMLRIVGVTRRQARRMVNAEQAGLLGVAVVLGAGIAGVTLTAVVNALTGSPLPWIPALGWVVVLGGAALLALGTTILPVRRLLRTPPIEHIGLKE